MLPVGKQSGTQVPVHFLVEHPVALLEAGWATIHLILFQRSITKSTKHSVATSRNIPHLFCSPGKLSSLYTVGPKTFKTTGSSHTVLQTYSCACYESKGAN